MKISIIACQDQNGLIGLNNSIPWKNKTDMKRFRELTTHNIILMGRKTYESIGKCLPNRINAVVSRNCFKLIDTHKWENAGEIMPDYFFSLEDAVLNFSTLGEHKHKDIFIIGGGEIYKQAFKYVDEIDLTQINVDTKIELSGNPNPIYFPTIPWYFKCISSTINDQDPLLTHYLYRRTWTGKILKYLGKINRL